MTESPRDHRIPVDLSKFSGASLVRGRSKYVEIAWWLVKLALIQSNFPWPMILKRRVLRIFGAQVGQNLYIRPGVNIHFPWKLIVGDNVWIGERTTILNLEPIVLEDNVALAHEVYLSAGGHDIRSPTFRYANKSICIGEGVWIGTRAFVGPGVVVGQGAVVAACACVVSVVEPWSIVGGVPARKIGERVIGDDL